MKSLDEMTDAELDRLTPEEINQIKLARQGPGMPPRASRVGATRDRRAGSGRAGGGRAARGTSSRPLIVGEGDSWFDYPFAVDILDALDGLGYQVIDHAKAGDTLENMAFGTKFDHRWAREATPLERTLSTIREQQPVALVWSGGGNDIAGPEFAAFLNHADLAQSRGLSVFRDAFAGEIIARCRDAYDHIIRAALDTKPDLHIFAHGYGYPIPDGRGWRLIGVDWFGPWLRPSITAKNIDPAEGRRIIGRLIDLFNRMLESLEQQHPQFHYLDLRSEVGDADWVNELHVSNSCYRRIARIFDQAIQAHVLGSPPRPAGAKAGGRAGARAGGTMRRRAGGAKPSAGSRPAPKSGAGTTKLRRSGEAGTKGPTRNNAKSATKSAPGPSNPRRRR